MPPRDRTRLLYHPVQPLSSWTVSRVRAALREHEEGNLSNSALLAEHMDRNPRIMAAVNTRVLGLLGLPLKVEPSESDKRRGKKVAKDLEKQWDVLAPEDTISELVRWAILLGVAFAEVVWTTEQGRWTPTLMPIHPALCTWSDELRRWQVQTTTGVVTIEPGDGRWLVLGYSRHRPWMRGIVRCLALEDKIRTEAVRDWARWSERHGIPIVLAKVPSAASEDDKQLYFDSIKTLGSGGTTVLAPQGSDENGSFSLDLVEAKDGGWEGFQALLQTVADDAAIATLGQNLTQETKGGSLAAAKVHDRVRGDYLEADATMEATCRYEQVDRPWALYNYGDADLAPWTCRDATPPEDQETKARTWKTVGDALVVWRSQGANVDIEAIAESCGLPLVKGTPLIEVESAEEPAEPDDDAAPAA